MSEGWDDHRLEQIYDEWQEEKRFYRYWFAVSGIVVAVLFLGLAALGSLGFVANRNRIDDDHATRQVLHLDSCRLANINRGVIRANLAQNYRDAVAFLESHPNGVPGLVLHNLEQLQENYNKVRPVNCEAFVRHPELPPKFLPVAPLKTELGG